MNPSFNFQKPVAVGADHAGVEYKDIVADLIRSKGHQVLDFGTYSTDAVDYPDFAHPVASAVENGEVACGILICGSANGVAITANKHAGIRAAVAWTEELAKLSRQHNAANILCIPSRFVSTIVAEDMVAAFLTSPFEGGRHERRVEKIACQ